MPPQLALIVFVFGIAGLFYLERRRGIPSSPVLWLPAAWVFLGASRMVSTWIGMAPSVDTPEQYLDGSPLDRVILSILLGAGLAVLLARRRRTWQLVKANGLMILFFVYCAASVFWSDFPDVAFKRWIKALGNVTMVFVVLTDPQPVAAMKSVLATAAFFSIPLSVLLIKYYPQLGRVYDPFAWIPLYTGVSDTKNGLGANCLVFGLGSFWRVLVAFETKTNRLRQVVAHGTIVAMALWLFRMADSMTSLSCFVLAAALIMVIRHFGTRRPATVHVVTGSLAFMALIGFLFQDLFTAMVQALGRNATLTGRTDIWEDIFRQDVNPWFGTGFESFWLGSRAEYFWNKYWFHPNQAHNGYIETYLTLGWVGIGFLVLMIVAGYRAVVEAFRRDASSGSLRLAIFAVSLVYNISEAAFKVMHPVWIAFLLAITAVSDAAAEGERPGGSRPQLATVPAPSRRGAAAGNSRRRTSATLAATGNLSARRSNRSEPSH